MLGEEVAGFIADQINARQKLYDNTGDRSQDKINLLSNQNTWVKLASGVELESISKKSGLAKAADQLAKIFSNIKGSNEIVDALNDTSDKYKGLLTPDAKDKISKLNLPEGSNINNLVGTQLAKFFVLFNGVSSLKGGSLVSKSGFSRDSIFTQSTVKGKNNKLIKTVDTSNSSYNRSNFGIVPMPGITDFNIKSLNRGSIKKATLKIKAHSREQFEILELLYLRLGYTVLVEYGNNIYIDNEGNIQKVGTTLIEDEEEGFFSEEFSNGGSYLEILTQIQRKVDENKGNYGGFLGKVVNFEWTIDELGSYDITLNLISLGDVIESLKINLPIDKIYANFLKAIGDLTSDDISQKDNISAMLYAYQYINKPLVNGTTSNDPSKTIYSIQNPSSNKPIKEEIGFLMSPGSDTLKATITYIRFKFKLINTIYVNDNGTRKRISADKSLKLFKDSKGQTKFSYTQKEMEEGKHKKDAHNFRIQYAKEKLIDSGYGLKKSYINSRAKKIGNEKISQFELYSYDEEEINNPCLGFESQDAFFVKNNAGNTQYYLRFGRLIEYIKTRLIPGTPIKNGTDFNPICDIDTTQNYRKDGMYTLPNQISLDPRVCVVRNQVVAYGTENGVYEVYDKLKPFREIDLDNQDQGAYGIGEYIDEKTGENVQGREVNLNRAYIPNIYLNFQFINDVLSNKSDEQGNVYLYGFFKEICVNINRALGGVNNLEPIIDETENRLKIIDFTPIPGQIPQTPETPYKINLFGFSPDGTGNFIRKLDIKTSITPEFASMVTIGSTASGYVKGTNGTAFSKWNAGLLDRFKPELVPNNTPGAKEQKNSDQISPTEPQENYIDNVLNTNKENSIWAILGSSFNPTGKVKYGLNATIIEKNLSIVTEFYKYALAVKTQKTKGSSVAGNIGFIPFKMSFTMNGMEGIKIYNVLHINSSFLPQSYGKSLDFITTGVDHSFKNNDWETTITTIVQPKSLATGIEDTTSVIENYNYLFTTEFFEEFEAYTPTYVAGGKAPIVVTNNESIRDPERAKGTLGTRGNIPPSGLSPTALNLTEIANIVTQSGTTDPLRKRIITIAASYVGQNETPGNNSGWHDPLFQAKMTPSTTGNDWGWGKGAAWCDYFASLVWYEAYTVGNALVDPANFFYKSIFNRSGLNGLNKGAKANQPNPPTGPFGSFVDYTRQYFIKMGKYITIKEAKSGKKLPQPGDMFTTRNNKGENHIGIVAKVFTKNGKLTQISTIEGNTGASNPRDGGETKYRQEFWSMSIVHGFCQVLTS